MSYLLDPDKSAEDNFYDLIKSENPLALYLKGRVVGSNPVTDEVTGLTTVQLVPIDGQGYIEEETIQYYRRPPVAASGTQNKAVIALTNGLPQATLKELISAHYRLISTDVVIRGLNSDTIILPEIGAVFTPDAGFRITAKSASLLYIDTGVPFEGKFTLADPSLLVDYRFEDDTKGTVVKNLAGSTDGIRTGTASAPRVGQIGNAWLLSGGSIDTGVKLPAGAVSVSMIINLQNKTGRQIFYSDHTAAALSGRLTIGIGGNQMYIRVCNGAAEFVVSTGFLNQIQALNMVHVGATLSADGGTLEIYRGGMLIRTIATGLTIPSEPSTSNLVIGNTAAGVASISPLSAIVENFKLFNRALTEDEWKQLGSVSPRIDSRWSQTKRGVNTSLGQSDRQAGVSVGNSIQGRVSAKSGKVMFEYTDTGNGAVLIGVGVIGAAMDTPPGGGGGNSYGYNAFDGNKYYASVPTAYGASFGVLSVIGVCVDFDNNTLTFYKDGVSQGVAFNIAPGTEFYPQLGSASGGSTVYGGLLNLGEDGFAYPVPGYTRWDVRVDLQLKIEALAYPFKDDGTKTFAGLKEAVALALRINTSGFTLGDINEEFIRPTDGLTTFEVDVPITATDPNLHFNGMSTSTVKFRFPAITIHDITQHFASTAGWAEDVDYGWYNDSQPFNTPIDLIGLPAVFFTQLTRIEGEFSHDPNTPADSVGQNQLILNYPGGSLEWLGTFDGMISQTQPGAALQIRAGNNTNYEELNAVTVTVDQTVTQQATLMQMQSGRDQQYAGSKRGCKWLRFTLRTI